VSLIFLDRVTRCVTQCKLLFYLIVFKSGYQNNIIKKDTDTICQHPATVLLRQDCLPVHFGALMCNTAGNGGDIFVSLVSVSLECACLLRCYVNRFMFCVALDWFGCMVEKVCLSVPVTSKYNI